MEKGQFNVFQTFKDKVEASDHKRWFGAQQGTELSKSQNESITVFENKLSMAMNAMKLGAIELPEFPLSWIYPEADEDPYKFSFQVNIALMRLDDRKFLAVTREIDGQESSVLVAGAAVNLLRKA